jgi:hypothetical protein
MSEQASENSRPGKAGKIQSFYVSYDVLHKLGAMAKERGVSRNRMLTVLVEEADR